MAINVAGGQLGFRATLDSSQFKAQLNRIEGDIKNFGHQVKSQTNEIGNLASRATSLAAGFFSTQAAFNFISSMVQVRGEFQKIEVSYKTILGNKEKADKLMAETVKLAATTPFKLQEVAEGSRKLLAYGFAADKVTDTLSMLGDVAAGVGAPLGDITYLYGTLQTQGRAYTKDIMQFTSRGIPILSELANVLGRSKEEVIKMVEAGEVGFPEVEKAFKNLTGAGGAFFNLMAEQSKTLTGQLSNLGDAWSRMLNDMGKSQEGIIGDLISGTTRLIDNYESVIDIIKVLIGVYGAYRAALIAEAAIAQLVIYRNAGVTASFALQYAQVLLVNKAMAVRAALMTSAVVGTVAFTGALASLGVVIYALSQDTDALKAAQDSVNDAGEEGNRVAAKQKAQITSLIGVIDDKSASLSQQQSAYEKLQGVTGGVLNSLTLEQFKLKENRGELAKYINSLGKAAQARILFAEFNQKAVELEKLNANGIKEIGMFERGLASIRDTFNPSDGYGSEWFKRIKNQDAADKKIVEDKKKFIKGQMDGISKTMKGEFKKLAAGVNDDTELTETLNKSLTNTLGGLEDSLDKERKALKLVALGSKEYAESKRKILKLEQEIEKWNGSGTGKSAGKSPRQQQVEEERALVKAGEDLVRKRLDFLKTLDEEENTIFLNSLNRNEKEVEANRQKYEKMRRDAEKLGLGVGVKERVNRQEEKTTGTINYQQDTENLKKELDEQKKIFDDFEAERRARGRKDAEIRFGEQKKGFETYAQYIQSKITETENASYEMAVGLMPPSEVQERLTLLREALKNAIEMSKQAKIEEFNAANELTRTYEQQRLEIIDEGLKREEALRSNPATKDLEGQLAMSRKITEDKLKVVEDEAYKTSEIYRLLNEDVYFYTIERIKKEKAILEKMLENDKTLTIAQREEVRARIKMLEELENAGIDTIEAMLKASQKLIDIANAFGALSDLLQEVNPDLADTVEVMEEIANVGAQAAKAIASFATKGGIVGGITLAISAVTGLVKLFKQAKESARKAREEIEAINLRNFVAEFDINEIFRERVRIQVKLNELRISGIRKESELLKQQAEGVQADYNKVLAELYKQVAVVGQKTEKYGGFLGIGRKTRVVNLTETLAGKSYADLEKLFLSGKLEGKAKELFETLQRLKAEGADIDQMLKDNQKEAMELFTGTTSDNLLDSIVEGFKNGKRAIEDFADDFESMMKAAVINALKYQVLEEPLAEFYKAFADAAKSGDVLTDTEIKQLEDQFNLIISAAGTRFEQLQRISKLNFEKLDPTAQTPEPERTGVAGAFAAASGEQIDALTGQFNGQRMATLEHVQVSKSQRDLMISSLATQVQIEINTRRAADFLKLIVTTQEIHSAHLASIDRKTGSTTATLAANGIGG